MLSVYYPVLLEAITSLTWIGIVVMDTVLAFLSHMIEQRTNLQEVGRIHSTKEGIGTFFGYLISTPCLRCGVQPAREFCNKGTKIPEKPSPLYLGIS